MGSNYKVEEIGFIVLSDISREDGKWTKKLTFTYIIPFLFDMVQWGEIVRALDKFDEFHIVLKDGGSEIIKEIILESHNNGDNILKCTTTMTRDGDVYKTDSHSVMDLLLLMVEEGNALILECDSSRSIEIIQCIEELIFVVLVQHYASDEFIQSRMYLQSIRKDCCPWHHGRDHD